MGRVMSPRVAICVPDAEGHPALPQSVQLGGHTVPIWLSRSPSKVGDLDAYEYRNPYVDHLVVLARIAPAGSHVVCVAFVPSMVFDGDNTVYDQVSAVLKSMGLLLADWPVADDLTMPELEVDESQPALAVRAAWPAAWRLRAPEDDPGELRTDGIPGYVREPGPATGARFLGACLA